MNHKVVAEMFAVAAHESGGGEIKETSKGVHAVDKSGKKIDIYMDRDNKSIFRIKHYRNDKVSPRKYYIEQTPRPIHTQSGIIIPYKIIDAYIRFTFCVGEHLQDFEIARKIHRAVKYDETIHDVAKSITRTFMYYDIHGIADMLDTCATMEISALYKHFAGETYSVMERGFYMTSCLHISDDLLNITIGDHIMMTRFQEHTIQHMLTDAKSELHQSGALISKLQHALTSKAWTSAGEQVKFVGKFIEHAANRYLGKNKKDIQKRYVHVITNRHKHQLVNSMKKLEQSRRRTVS